MARTHKCSSEHTTPLRSIPAWAVYPKYRTEGSAR
jgi:hypothetical protein